MKFQAKVAIVVGALALSAAPAVAAGPSSGTPGPSSNPSSGHVPENPGTANIPATPGPGASAGSLARAYGSYCKDAGTSKQHVEGQKGTPFSVCVTGMAKLANDQARNPRTACKDESKGHVEGQKGTPFSQCVSAGAKLLKDLDSAA